MLISLIDARHTHTHSTHTHTDTIIMSKDYTNQEYPEKSTSKSSSLRTNSLPMPPLNIKVGYQKSLVIPKIKYRDATEAVAETVKLDPGQNPEKDMFDAPKELFQTKSVSSTPRRKADLLLEEKSLEANKQIDLPEAKENESQKKEATKTDEPSKSPPKTMPKTSVFERNILKRADSLEGIKFAAPSEQTQTMLNTDKFGHASDVGCLAIRCAGHRLLALVDLEHKGLFLPYFNFSPAAQSIEAILEHFIHKVLFNRPKAKLPPPQLIRIDRLQLPKTKQYVSRYFYQLNLEAKNVGEGPCLCQAQHPTPLEWCSLNMNLRRVRSYETIYFLRQVEPLQKKYQIQLSETSVDDVLASLLNVSEYQTLLDCANFGRPQLLSLYNEFLLHCYPATTVSTKGLRTFLSKVVPTQNFDKPKGMKFYKAFGGERKIFLNFQDIVVGLAAVAIKVNDHTRKCSHYLCQELRRKMINQAQTTESLDLDLNFDNIFLPQFSTQPIQSTETPPPPPATLSENEFDSRGIVCQQCRRSSFSLASHSVVLSEIGEVNVITSLDDPKKPGPRLMFRNDIDESNIHILANDLINRIKNFGSFVFNPERLAQSSSALHSVIENWFFQSKEEMVNYLKMIANKAEQIFASEPRVLHISSPVYVFGDIHGNLKDLLSYSEHLWKQSPFINHGSYLFLGDYVDRGLYGVECVIFLFCMKILAPKNFFILRGNHEIREIQDQFTFTYECSSRFNVDLWDGINNAFDNLPLVGVIDDQVFCAHGGIPVSVNTLEQLRAIPAALETPMTTSIEAWEVLWNDPISEEEFQHLSDFERNFTITSRGFARNTKRGTAYMYTEEAVENFFSQNRLSRIVRGHEVFDEGFRIHHKGNTFTVFSTSHYADLTNRACCFFFDGHTIRIIQMVPDDND